MGVCISGTMSLLVVCLGGWICLGGWVESMSGVGMSSGWYVGWGYVQGVGPGRGWVLTPRGTTPKLTSSGGHRSGRYASYWNAFLFC